MSSINNINSNNINHPPETQGGASKSSCSSSSPSQEAAPRDSLEPLTSKVMGLFYKIVDNQGQVRGFIFGSWHHTITREDTILLDPKIKQSLAQTDYVAMELDILKYLPTETTPEQLQVCRNMVPELDLALEAKENGKTIIELETKEFQDQNKGEAFQDALKKFNQRLSFEDDIDIYEIFNGWKSGSEKMVYDLIHWQQSEEFAKRFYDERNISMVEKTLSYLKTGKVFLAVGAGHVVGDQGICALLRKQGFSVIQITE